MRLKEALNTAPVLAFPEFDLLFIVETDASSRAVGAVLAQKQEGSIHPIQYTSRSLNSAEKNYSACEREAVAVIFALRKFRIFLLSGHRFDLVTDHKALRYGLEKKDVHGKIARWLDFIAEYDFKMIFRRGTENKAADYLSRYALSEPSIGIGDDEGMVNICLLYTSPSPRDLSTSRMPSSA